MTTQKKLQNYFIKLPIQYMHAICKFKCTNHKLPIVIGRYTDVALDDRLCTLVVRDGVLQGLLYGYKEKVSGAINCATYCL